MVELKPESLEQHFYPLLLVQGGLLLLFPCFPQRHHVLLTLRKNGDIDQEGKKRKAEAQSQQRLGLIFLSSFSKSVIWCRETPGIGTQEG